MVKLLDAVVADGTMRSTGRTVEQASVAELDFHGVPINDDVSRSRKVNVGSHTVDPFQRIDVCVEQGVCLRRLGVPRYDTRISHGCQEKEHNFLH